MSNEFLVSVLDTYVKTYVKDGQRRILKRKTRCIRNSCKPQYRQIIRYSACSVIGRIVSVAVWQKQGAFSNLAIGGMDVQVEKINLHRLTVGWYKIFKLSNQDISQDDSSWIKAHLMIFKTILKISPITFDNDNVNKTSKIYGLFCPKSPMFAMNLSHALIKFIRINKITSLVRLVNFFEF